MTGEPTPEFFDQDGPGLFDSTPPATEPPSRAPNTKPDATASKATTTEAAAPLALYRRYRPDTFADVIGQEHVTEPLMRALTNNRVNHAYLFSGPRGCGKTTSARILARALNCENGPTPVPCGECQSCKELARGGPGSIDVIEIDAASHGNVDEARDLRERAFFAPVRSRYKIYIIDEAHMVTPQGFNALLKVVEEPPPHVKFIFATTEPEKVLGTIKSRTHHYPFRLVPPKTLGGYLAKLCEAEGVALDPKVLPLIVRAGGGSVRDSLSVLDQLLGGAGSQGVTYEQAAALLGYTPEALLDDLMDCFAAADAEGVFACIDRVIETGQDPRRFGEDILERLRDLIIVDAVPEALTNGLVTVAGDQADRLRTQAAALGPGELTRAAEVIATGLNAMRGTTSPRLYLELMCARVLLPGADVDERGIHARLDRIERRLGMGRAGLEHTGAIPRIEAPAPKPAIQPAATPPARPATPPARPATPPAPEPAAAPSPPPRETAPTPATPTAAAAAAAPAPETAQLLSTADLRRMWPQVLDELSNLRRFAWILVSQNGHVVDVQDNTVTLGLATAGARDSFDRAGCGEIVTLAIANVTGSQLRVTAIIDESDPGRGRPAAPARPATTPSEPPASPSSPATAKLVAQAKNEIRPTRNGAPEPEPETAAPTRDDAVIPEDDRDAKQILVDHLGAEPINEE